MNSARKEFRDRLVKMEQKTAGLQDKYQEEIKVMFETQLTRRMKWEWIVTGILSIGFVVLFGTAAIMAPSDFPVLGRLLFGSGAVFGLAWAVLAAVILRRGSVNVTSHGKAAAGMAWCFAVLLMAAVLVLASKHPDRIVGLHMICGVVPFLIIGAVFLLQYRIQEAELKTREKLLEIELRIAELAETLEAKE